MKNVLAIDNGRIIGGPASEGSGSGGGMSARLMITSSVTPTVISPSGKTLTPTLVDGETDRYFCDTQEYGVHAVTQTTGGSTATINVNVRECKIYDVADKTTFAGIQQILNSHMETELLSIGDEVPLTLSGGIEMIWQVAAINHELKYGHQVIFVPKWCLPDGRPQNTSNTNSGGWNSSALRAWLNDEFLNDYLPQDINSLIKNRDIIASQGSQSSNLQTAVDKIWLPRQYEMFGSNGYAAATEHTQGSAEQFPIFVTLTNRIKTLGQNGAASPWWNASPNISTSSHFCGLTLNGELNYMWSATPYGVAPCFHLTAD